MAAGVSAGSSGGWQVRLQIDGVTNTVRALRTLAPDISKRMLKELRQAGNRIARGAQSKFAEAEGPSASKGDYAVRMRTRRQKGSEARFSVGVYAKSKNAAIFELAAASKTPQGAAMVSWLDSYGSPGRFLWDTWDEIGGEVQDAMRMSIARAESELQARIDAGTGRGQVV